MTIVHIGVVALIATVTPLSAQPKESNKEKTDHSQAARMSQKELFNKETLTR